MRAAGRSSAVAVSRLPREAAARGCHRSRATIKCAAVRRLTGRHVAVPRQTCVGCICASDVHVAACVRFPCQGWGAARVLLPAAVLCIHRTLLRMDSDSRKAVSNVGRTACRRSWVRTPGVAGGLGTVQLSRPALDCVWASQISFCILYHAALTYLTEVIKMRYTLGSSPDSLLASEAANDELRE